MRHSRTARAVVSLCLVLSVSSIVVAQSPQGLSNKNGGRERDGKHKASDPQVAGTVEEVEGTEKANRAPVGVRIVTIPAASFSNTFEQSNQSSGRIHFRPSAGFFTADRSTGAYAKEGFSLGTSGLRIVNVRLHARDNSNQNALVHVYGIDKGTTSVTNVALFVTGGASTSVRTFDYGLSHIYQGTRYYTVSVWLPDQNVDVYGVEIWYEESDPAGGDSERRSTSHGAQKPETEAGMPEEAVVGRASKHYGSSENAGHAFRIKLINKTTDLDEVVITLSNWRHTQNWRIRRGRPLSFPDLPSAGYGVAAFDPDDARHRAIGGDSFQLSVPFEVVVTGKRPDHKLEIHPLE